GLGRQLADNQPLSDVCGGRRLARLRPAGHDALSRAWPHGLEDPQGRAPGRSADRAPGSLRAAGQREDGQATRRQRSGRAAWPGRPGDRVMRARLWRLAVFLFILGFTLNLVGIVSHVAVSSFARRWFATPLPPAWTTEWYVYSWREFQLADVLTVTAIVALTVPALALLLGFPAAYVLARRGFRAKNAVLLLYFLPLLIPQMTYGIPLATSLYRYRVGGTMAGVILAN